MEEELKQLQIQLSNNIEYTELILSTTKEIVDYVHLGPKFFKELELVTSTLRDLMERISKTIDPKDLDQFFISAKQVKMMAEDLLSACKKKMFAA